MVPECDCEICDCTGTAMLDSYGYLDGRCDDCIDGFHEYDDTYSEILERSGWGSWDDGGLR